MSPNRTRRGLISIVALCSVAGLAASASAIEPEWLEKAGLDFWNLRSAEDGLKEARQERDKIAAEETHLYQTIEANDMVVTQLIAGNISLTAAADQIEHINSDRGGFFESLHATHPSSNTHRDLCILYLFSKIARKLKGDPARLAAVNARLEGEWSRAGHGSH